MKSRNPSRAFRALSLLAALAAACLPPGGAGARAARAQEPDKLVVIVNKSNNVDNLKLSDLCGYFLLEHVDWPKEAGAGRVRVVMLPRGVPEREAALRLICKMGEKEYTNYFLSTNFRVGANEGLRLRNSAAEVINYVSTNPGAIGYVRFEEVTTGVKIIKVDGREPGAADYGLKL